MFDAEYYAETYPDVVAVFGDDENVLLQHYLSYGIAEGRSANAYYNALAYKTVNTDLAAALGDDWDAYADHFINYGADEGRYAGGTRAITDEEKSAVLAKMSSSSSTSANASQTQQSAQSTKTSAASSSGVSRNAADYRSISSFSELTPYNFTSLSAWIEDIKTLEKVAYTHNGVTVLLYDMIEDDGGIALYDFADENYTWRFNDTSTLDKEIEAGGYATYSDIKYWNPIADYQLYTDSVTLEELEVAQGTQPYEEVWGEVSRNKSDYRSISSLSELTPYSRDNWPSNFETLEKVAYTHNGVTVLLYDIIGTTQHDITYHTVYLYSFEGISFNFCSASQLDKYIEAGGWTFTYILGDGEHEYWQPISIFQVY